MPSSVAFLCSLNDSGTGKGSSSEIVVLDEKGRSNFYDLMTRRGEPRSYAFDLVWFNRQDLRSRFWSASRCCAG